MLSDRSPRVDNTLLGFSLLQDLKSLTDLNHAISEENSLITTSWLYPNQTAMDQPEVVLMMKVESDEDYTDCLEMIIDRIYSILNNFLNILEDMTRGPAHMYKNIAKPEQLTLSLIAASLYEKIQHLSALKEYNTQSTHADLKNISGKSHKEAQVNIKMTQCPRCIIAQRCIKSIAEELTKPGDVSCVTKTKEDLKSVIFQSTQEESLDLLTSAINKDVQNLIGHNEQLKAKLDHVKAELDKFENFHQDSVKRIGELEDSVKELDECREKEMQKQIVLRNIVNKLFKDKKTLEGNVQQNKEHIKQLEGLIEGQADSIKELHEELDSFRSINKRLLSQEKLLNTEKDLWKVRLNRTKEEHDRIKEQNKRLHNILLYIRDLIFNIENNYLDLEQNISESCSIIENSLKSNEDLLTRIEDMVKTSVVLADSLNSYAHDAKHIAFSVSNMTNPTTEDIKVEGDPLLDMMKQVECNDKNIEKMRRQNEVLSKTIRRFQERKMQNNQ